MRFTTEKIKKTQKEIYLLTTEQNLDILSSEVIKHESSRNCQRRYEGNRLY